MESEFIGIVKCSDWYDLENVNQNGWCFDYNDLKDDLYIVWFSEESFGAVLDVVNEYTLLKLNGFGEPVQVYKKGNLQSIRSLIENKENILDSINCDYYRVDVKEYFKRLEYSYKLQKELGLNVI